MSSVPFAAPKNVVDYLSLHEEALVPSNSSNQNSFPKKKLRSLLRINEDNIRVQGLKLPHQSKRPTVSQVIRDFFLHLLVGKFKSAVTINAGERENCGISASKQIRSGSVDDIGVLAAEVSLPCYVKKFCEKLELPTDVLSYLTLTESLHTYFNACLPHHLLYERERAQYDDFVTEIRDENEKRAKLCYPHEMPRLNETLNAAEVYGVEYLLRLIVKLPSLFNQSASVEMATQLIIADMLQELTLFITHRREEYLDVWSFILVMGTDSLTLSNQPQSSSVKKPGRPREPSVKETISVESTIEAATESPVKKKRGRKAKSFSPVGEHDASEPEKQSAASLSTETVSDHDASLDIVEHQDTPAEAIASLLILSEEERTLKDTQLEAVVEDDGYRTPPPMATSNSAISPECPTIQPKSTMIEEDSDVSPTAEHFVLGTTPANSQLDVPSGSQEVNMSAALVHETPTTDFVAAEDSVVAM